MKKKRRNSDPPAPLTTDHFDLAMKRLEDVYLKSIKAYADSINDSISKMKTYIEIICVAIVSAIIVYIVTTLVGL